MKKVLLIAPMASVHEKFNIVNIQVLQAMKCEIHLMANFCTSEHDKIYKKAMEIKNITTWHLPFERGSLKNNLKLLPEIKKIIKREEYDLVHCHTETGGILTRLCQSGSKKTKYIYTPHGMSFYKGSSLKSQVVYRMAEKWICKKMNAVLAINRDEMQILRKWDKQTAKLVHGIGLDTDSLKSLKVDVRGKREELNIPNRAFMLLSVGELNENKNHRVVIQALAEMNRSDIYYVICGKGDKRDELEAMAYGLGVKDQVIFAGFRYDVKEIFKSADIFVFPSYHEGLPVSVMEAMACGLPVVCSAIRGNVDLIENGINGYLFSPEDFHRLKELILRLTKNKSVIKKMKEANLKKIEKYSMKVVGNEIHRIYEEVLR